MTPQEIINEIQKLPPSERKEVIDSIVDNGEVRKTHLTEDEFEQVLFHQGIIGAPADLNNHLEDDEDFEPIQVEGEPISEMIIRERR